MEIVVMEPKYEILTSILFSGNLVGIERHALFNVRITTNLITNFHESRIFVIRENSLSIRKYSSFHANDSSINQKK